MPFGDRTGPMGLGPMTGRGMGYCAGFPTPGYMNPGPGRGWGWRWWCGPGWWGRGRGWRWWFRFTGLPFWARWSAWFSPFWGTPSEKAKEAELEFLREEVKNLEEALKEARRRMEEIEKEVSQGKAQ